MSLINRLFRSRSATRRGHVQPQMCESLEQRQLLAAPPFAAGHTIVDFTFTWSTPGGGNTSGSVWIELYDQETPQTVANFLKYVDATDNHKYKNTFVHRNETDFVLQLGGYYLDPANSFALEDVDRYAPVVNEVPSGSPETWPPERRNLERTVAMAKIGSDPNSATSEFFFNLGDNTGGNPPNQNVNGLDYQNSGFTVFGYVVNGWDVVLAMKQLSTVDFQSEAFRKVPVGASFVDGTSPVNNDMLLVSNVTRINNPGWSQQPGVNQTVNGAGKANGQTLFVTVTDQGRAIAYHQATPTSGWTVSDINIQSTGPTLVGKVYAWADSKDGLFYATAATAAGLILYQRSADGFWEKRNLTGEISGAGIITTDITTFTSIDGYQFIAGITGSNGHIVLYSQTTAAPTNGNYSWEFADLVTRDFVPEGLTMPSIVGSISSYVTSWNGLNIAGLDALGNVQSIWWAPGVQNNHWRTDNLSALTGAPAFTGTLTPYVTSWGGINLAGTDATGNVITTWWVPGNPWTTSNLTSLFSGPPLVANTLSSYVTPWGGLNIAGLNSAGTLVVYWWAPGLTNWNVTVDLVPGAVQPVAGSRVTGVASPDGTINLVARGTNGHTIRYHWSSAAPANPWVADDLSSIATFF